MSDVELADCIREACREAGLDPTRHLSPEVGVRRLVEEIATLKARAEEAERKADIAATEWAATMNAARIDHVATVAAESRARRAETLVKHATAFRFPTRIELRLHAGWWGAWIRDERKGVEDRDLPPALRALRDAGLLPDELAKVIE